MVDNGQRSVSQGNDESLDNHRGDVPLAFPWATAGMVDVHCHPTDTPSYSLSNLPRLQTHVLVAMSTRAQDQHLPTEFANQFPITRVQPGSNHRSHSSIRSGYRGIIPAYGWHPWFSHLLYDDVPQDSDGVKPTKVDHYSKVLTPSPLDESFLERLDEPSSLSSYLERTRARLQQHPEAIIGEIGLDKAFRIPDNDPDSSHELPSKAAHIEDSQKSGVPTPGTREGQALTRCHVTMSQQILVFRSLLQLAGEMGRAVSVHSVQCHGLVYDILAELWKGHELEVPNKKRRQVLKRQVDEEASSDDDDDDDEASVAEEKKPSVDGDTSSLIHRLPWTKPFPPHVCLHSYSGSKELVTAYLRPSVPCRIYFSFSEAINIKYKGPASVKMEEIIACVPDDRILVESDLHLAGPELDAALEAITRHICQIKKWTLDHGVRQLQENAYRFLMLT